MGAYQGNEHIRPRRICSQGDIIRNCAACAYGTEKRCSDECTKCCVLSRQTEEVAQRYGRVISGCLLGNWQSALGFEDEPVTYFNVGWPGGRPPPKGMEDELARRLARVFREDARRLMTDKLERERRENDARNRKAFDDWIQRKSYERRLAGQAVSCDWSCD